MLHIFSFRNLFSVIWLRQVRERTQKTFVQLQVALTRGQQHKWDSNIRKNGKSERAELLTQLGWQDSRRCCSFCDTEETCPMAQTPLLHWAPCQSEMQQCPLRKTAPFLPWPKRDISVMLCEQLCWGKTAVRCTMYSLLQPGVSLKRHWWVVDRLYHWSQVLLIQSILDHGYS